MIMVGDPEIIPGIYIIMVDQGESIYPNAPSPGSLCLYGRVQVDFILDKLHLTLVSTLVNKLKKMPMIVSLEQC